MTYLQLLPNAEFVYFGLDGCVFHLWNQKRFPCDRKSAALLNELLRGKPYEEAEYENEFNEYLLELMQEGMLYPYSTPVYHEIYEAKSRMEIRGLFEEPPQMRQIYIQGASKCNYACSYCRIDKDQTVVNNGCKSCILWGTSCSEDTALNQIEAIKRLLQLHHSDITISGGNVFLNWEYIRNVLDLILSEDQAAELHIIHNGSMVTDEILHYIKVHEIYLEVMVLGYDERSWQSVTGSEDACQEFGELMRKIREFQIRYSFVLIGSKETLKHIQKFADDNYPEAANSIVEIGEENERLATAVSYEERMRLPLDEFSSRKRYNRCLYGTLALALDGTIRACPMFDETLADLKEQNLEYIFQSRIIDKYWRMTRQSYSSCVQCPYQWLCSDCMKALETAGQNGGRTGSLCERMGG